MKKRELLSLIKDIRDDEDVVVLVKRPNGWNHRLPVQKVIEDIFGVNIIVDGDLI